MVDDPMKQYQHKKERIVQVFKGDNDVVPPARVKMILGEFNTSVVVTLIPVFFKVFSRSKTGPAMLAPLCVIIKSHQTERINFETSKNCSHPLPDFREGKT